MALIQEHSEVLEALEMVLEELTNESKNIYGAGGKQLTNGNVTPALQAIEYAKRLGKMKDAVKEIRDQWTVYLHDIDQVSAEVREILRWQRPTAEREVGHRTVGEIAQKTGLAVKFADGTTIREKTAKETFAKVIEKLGAKRVAELGILVARQPLVAKDRSDYDGPANSLASIKDGWTVRTDCSTRQKERYLMGIAGALKEKLEIEIVGSEGVVDAANDEVVELPEKCTSVPRIFQKGNWKGQREVPGIPKGWKVSDVVKCWFPLLFKRNLVTDEEVEFFLTREASEIFKVGGRPVLLVNRGRDADRYFPLEDGTMQNRYYKTSTVDLHKGDRRFYLSSQFMPWAMGPLIHYLEVKGISRADIIQAVQAFKG